MTTPEVGDASGLVQVVGYAQTLHVEATFKAMQNFASQA